MFPTLFVTLVRPHLESGNILWHLRFKLDADKVERVQRRATRIVPGFSNLPYEERLRVLSLHSLYYRRRQWDMITVYKLLNGLLGVSEELFFTRAIHSATRGHNYKLYTNRSKLDIRCNIFSHGVIADWNSTGSFKKPLDKHWWDQRFDTATPHSMRMHPVNYLVQLHSNMTSRPEYSQDVILLYPYPDTDTTKKKILKRVAVLR